jgi:hypothetical protein
MKPKIVFSYAELKRHKGFEFYHNKEEKQLVVKKATLSLKLIQKHNYQSVLFVDKQSKELFAHLPYDEIKIIPSSLTSRVPSHFWSLGKLYAYSKINEPFAHLDFDVFMFEDFLISYKDWPYYAYCKEKWTKSLAYPSKHLFQIYMPELAKFKELYSYNCCVFGGKNWEVINRAADKTIALILKRKKQYITHAESNFKSVYKTDGILPWYLALLFEQIIFIHFLMEEQNLINFPTIAGTKDSIDDVIRDFKKLKMFHLWGDEMKHVVRTCFGYNTFVEILDAYSSKKCCKTNNNKL